MYVPHPAGSLLRWRRNQELVALVDLGFGGIYGADQQDEFGRRCAAGSEARTLNIRTPAVSRTSATGSPASSPLRQGDATCLHRSLMQGHRMRGSFRHPGWSNSPGLGFHAVEVANREAGLPVAADDGLPDAWCASARGVVASRSIRAVVHRLFPCKWGW